MRYSSILKKALKDTIAFIGKDKSMIILSLLLLRGRARRTEILTHCMEITEDLDMCRELMEYINGNKKYFEEINDTIALKEDFLVYADTLYDILQDLDNFILKAIKQHVTINDIVSRSLTPSALLLVLSSNPEDTGFVDLTIYYFTTILLAEVFLRLSETNQRFRELVSTIESMFST